MDFKTIVYDKSEGVALIRLNRPERHNAVDSVMSRELPRVWEAVNKDPEVRVAIVTGAGDRSLCTGFDVTDMDAGRDSGEDADQGTRASVRWTAIQNHCWKPVITAVNGMACGGGLHFVADSDITICAEHATFFDTHVKVGLVMGLEAVGLARRIPLEWVLRMGLVGGGERIDAATALRIGLVSEVVAGDRLLARAREIAELVKGHSPTALARTKRAVWEGLDRGLDAALEHAWALVHAQSEHSDAAEGARAFVERRKPRWAPLSD